jgi:nucleotide-binding universal stress UspA family protein
MHAKELGGGEMKILIAYDGSKSADAAIEDLCKAGLPPGAEALVLCVADGHLPAQYPGHSDTHSDHSWMSRLTEAEALANKGAERVGSLFPKWKISSEALWGSPGKIIMNTCGSWHPDLVVIGSHGRSAVVRAFLGSVSMELIHRAPCSVRITRIQHASSGDPLRIIIGDDGSKEAEEVTRIISERSWPENTEAKIILVAKTLVPAPTGLEESTFAQEPAFAMIREADEHERMRLRSVADHSLEILCRAGLNASASVIDGDPGEVILTEAELFHADNIFIGARGLGRMERLLLGSVSTHVVSHARCTVEVVR